VLFEDYCDTDIAKANVRTNIPASVGGDDFHLIRCSSLGVYEKMSHAHPHVSTVSAGTSSGKNKCRFHSQKAGGGAAEFTNMRGGYTAKDTYPLPTDDRFSVTHFMCTSFRSI
jgi:hypothetical protein